ncbi:MAG: type IV secretory system conjugative DNA transfer family protein, partial [Rhodobacteraceae bacterium]|nr:type IV secretory system conjugative DNA transfer family protein [Paracoccaceae bacterium]
MIGPLLLAAGVLTVVPFALLTALVWFAWWPPHWLEPVLLLSLPAMCIPGLVRPAPPALRRHWWGGMILLTAAWYLASPHLTPVGGLSIGSVARIFAAEIELMFYGEVVWSPAFRLASFATAGVAAVAAVSMASWYAMAGLQWAGERTKAAAPARPVNRLSDAAWAGRAEVLDRFSTPGGIVLGELTDPRRKVRFDPAVPRWWWRQGKGPLITLDPATGNAHSLVFSGSGSFKTVGIAIPNALTFAGSLIVIDPKGEIHAATSAVRFARGRKPWLVTEEDGLDPIRLLTAARPNDGTVFDSIAEFLLP